MESLSIALIAAALLAIGYALSAYNRLVKMRNRVRHAWSDIDVQLTFRHNLVPNLVETAKGYISHERQTLEAATLARTAAMNTGTDVGARSVSETLLGSAVGNLFAVSERYPDLKACENFLLLQEQLTTTENRIAFARQHYNETVRQFNTSLAEFPRNILARIFGYSPETMFAAEPQDRHAVQIN